MTTKKLTLLALTILAAALALWALPPDGDGSADAGEAAAETAPADAADLARATFAGGCFWCMEPPFDKLDGVVATTSGYIDGHVENPTYHQVSSGATGHAEAMQVTYDPERVSYSELLEVFWHNIDPTVEDRQFCDWGSQYRTGIYAHDDEQLRLAEKSKQDLIDSGRFEHVYTDVKRAPTFYPAEDYHQDFYKKNPGHYKSYRYGCGRDRRLEELWGDGD
jgi:peptide-methionine (S)-S-oxide reductase